MMPAMMRRREEDGERDEEQQRESGGDYDPVRRESTATEAGPSEGRGSSPSPGRNSHSSGNKPSVTVPPTSVGGFGGGGGVVRAQCEVGDLGDRLRLDSREGKGNAKAMVAALFFY